MQRPFLVLAMLAAILASLRIAPSASVASAATPRLKNHAPAQLAQVRYILHGLSVRPPGKGARKGAVKMALFDRYGLQTSSNQKASIGFHDGTVLHINENTDAVLSGHVTHVNRGEVAEYLAPGTDHRVETDAAVAAAVGTVYDVETDGTTSTFTVLHGALQVSNPHGAVLVKSNHQTHVRPTAPPQPPTPADARAVFSWTQGIPTPDLGEDVALDANAGSVAGFSSQRSTDEGAADRINDGLLSDGWETDEGKTSNQQVTVGFLGGNFYRISDIIIDPAAPYGDPASMDLKDFAIRISSTDTADTSFTTIYQGRCKQQASLQHFHLPVPVRARYVQLQALSNYGNPHRLAVAELEVVATESLFAHPSGIAVDENGFVYTADANSNRIFKLSPKGKVVAAWGSKGKKPGQFLRPYGLALDSAGDIYVADTYNHRVQKLSPRGKVLTTWGSSGLSKGQFLFPKGIAVDLLGNVYVTDFGRVQKFSSTGKLLAVFDQLGDGLVMPWGITIDNGGNLLVADENNNRIIKLSTSGKVLDTFGAGGSDPGQFTGPTGIAVDRQGNIYVADSTNDRIQKLDPAHHATVWGQYGIHPGEFAIPEGIATDAHGNLFVADSYNSRIQKLSAATGKPKAVWGKYVSLPQVLGQPGGLAVDSRGHLYVTDSTNDRVQQRSTKDGHVEAVYGYHGVNFTNPKKGLGQFWWPHGIAVAPDGTIYVTDSSNQRIQLLANRGPIGVIGERGTAPGQFIVPMGVAVDAQGNIVVADFGNSRVQKLSPSGTPIWSTGSYGTDPGQFELPSGVAVDSQGNVYVSEVGGYRVQKLSPEGKPLAVWGKQDFAGLDRFAGPYAITVDAHDNVYVADSGHNVVQKLSPEGKVLQVYEIPGPDAQPDGIAVDSHGTLYVSDLINSRIVKLAPTGEVLAIWS